VAKSKLRDAKQVLDLWKSSYFKVRAEIEDTGRNQRWEFDRKKLFEMTDYIASICRDLLNVLQVCVYIYFTDFQTVLKKQVFERVLSLFALCRFWKSSITSLVQN